MTSGYDDLRELLSTEPVAGIFCEAPSNPLLRCVDFPRVREILRELCPDAPLIVDDTIATVAHADVLRFADIATASLTKTFSGTGDVMAGSVILSRQSPFHGAFSDYLRHQADHELWCGDAVALEENSRDFVARADRSSANAQALAEFLRGHPRVAQVWHPSTDGGVGYESVRRPSGGYGCLVSFVLKDAESGSPGFFDALEVSKGPSLGSNFTLACPYTLLAHYDELDWAESCGVPRYLIRVSAGLEEKEDLIGRFARALPSAKRSNFKPIDAPLPLC
jgi:cystathionine gamma-synthase